MEAKLANAEASVAEAKKKVARAEAKVASAMNDAREAKSEVQAMAKKMAAAMAAPIAGDVAGKTPADNSGIAAKAGSDSKAAAELEVKRRLEAAEKAKKAAEAAEDAEAKKNAKKEDKDESVLSLDDQIKRLKMQRDQQIAESETRIRAKQQREIDELIKKGKAIDSDEVKAAVGKMKNAIKTSEEKLRSRFLRRLERLKEDMKGQ